MNEAAKTIAALIERLGQVERSLLTHRAFGCGLSATQGQILLHLADRPVGVMALAEILALAPGTVSEAVSALVRKGLLARQRHPLDARRHVLVPTEAGRRMAAALRDYDQPLIAALVQTGLGEETGRVLMEVLARLIEGGVIADTGMCLTCRHLRRREGGFHCALIDQPLALATLRLACPDHEEKTEYA
ncbi:MAG: MarR family transcriptional regulator [Alphaproteobacteria bacterium]|nr:MAG: MarR family transcriptional regulator [Alphaproteobacteria bacterium]